MLTAALFNWTRTSGKSAPTRLTYHWWKWSTFCNIYYSYVLSTCDRAMEIIEAGRTIWSCIELVCDSRERIPALFAVSSTKVSEFWQNDGGPRESKQWCPIVVVLSSSCIKISTWGKASDITSKFDCAAYWEEVATGRTWREARQAATRKMPATNLLTNISRWVTARQDCPKRRAGQRHLGQFDEQTASWFLRFQPVFQTPIEGTFLCEPDAIVSFTFAKWCAD